MARTVTVVDHGAGNLSSVLRALEHVGATVNLTADPAAVRGADRVVMPGQGAFDDCMKRLRNGGMDDAVRDFIGTGRPYLGISLGLQVLFEWSHEHGTHEGLGVLPGVCVPLSPRPGVKIPHMGWNSVHFDAELAHFEGIESGDMFYFVHSYHVVPSAPLPAARTEHGTSFVSAVAVDNVMACQFHPEKSQRVGLTLLRNFVS